MTDLTDIVHELYATRLDAFVRTRNERARTARADGDRDLATTLAALPKAPVSAWVVNLLARKRLGDLTHLLDLGARMQQAQEAADGDALRTLAADRARALDEVVAAGVDAAATEGQAVSEAARARVTQTLRAAMADPAAGGAVLSGMLVRDLASPGFGLVDLDGALAVPDELAPYVAGDLPTPPETAPRADPGRAAAVEEARARLDEATRQAKESATAREAAHDELATIRERAEELRATDARLREELRDVKSQMLAVQSEARAAERSLRAAESESSEARFVERRRQVELDELSD